MPDDADIPTVQPADSPRELPVARQARRASPPESSGFRTLLRWFVSTALIVSLGINVVLVVWLLPDVRSNRLSERYYSGEFSASDKIAIVQIDGILMDGATDYASQQIKDAAQDEDVKAVVVAVNSPGGSVMASDLLYQQIKDLREGKWENQRRGKPVVVAMESVAASGGYYIAVPADKIFAQPATQTGSIGVWLSLLDLSKVPEHYHIDMRTFQAGELKTSGGMFKDMTPQERKYLQEGVDKMYDRFLKVIKEGRGSRLKHNLRDEIASTRVELKDGQIYVRRLADGGVFMADDAKNYGLVDEIGYTREAVEEAKQIAGLRTAKVITYNRPVTFMGALLGVENKTPEPQLRLDQIPGTTARLWYLAPGYELTGARLPLQLPK